MCDSGVGTARNAAEAAVRYASAAAHGVARAEYNLAQLYAAGDGVPPISTWQKHGMPRQRLTDSPQRRVSSRRCVRIAPLLQRPFLRKQH